LYATIAKSEVAMAKGHPDDFEAVRTIVATLDPFDPGDQERILRWAREKLGLSIAPAPTPAADAGNETKAERASGSAAPAALAKASDIRTFITNKRPQSDIQFAAAVAYFYRFEAPEPQRKETITADDLQDASRQTGRERFTRPAQTLVNTHNQGYLDKGSERGSYAINTVGENLVAMALPGGTTTGNAVSSRRRSPRSKSKGGKKGRQ
jgi:hypothetical protein